MNRMDVLINLLGLLLIIAIVLAGITGSGLLAARHMAPTEDIDATTDQTERNLES